MPSLWVLGGPKLAWTEMDPDVVERWGGRGWAVCGVCGDSGLAGLSVEAGTGVV